MTTTREIIDQRLLNQRVAGEPFDTPEEVVQWLGAVQSQDYAGARWSVGQRTKNCVDADVAQAFDAGTILRTHVLRPTWHFVMPADIRWMLELTAPRVKALNAYYYRKLEFDDSVLRRSQMLIADALRGGEHRTRAELAGTLERAGIVADGLRLTYIVMHAELDGLICSGAVRGKQHTYALLDARAPNAKTLTHDEALAELTRRFFTSHGPVTVKDYVRWSGLRIADAKRGIEMVRQSLVQDVVSGETYWSGASIETGKSQPLAVYLLPEYDECVLTYKSLNFPDLPWDPGRSAWSDAYYRPIIIDGKRAGTWRRTIKKGAVILEANLFATLNAAQVRALDAAIERYSRFIGMPVTLVKL